MDEFNSEYYGKMRQQAERIYNSQKTIFNPYLKTNVYFTADGLHHLRYSARNERNKREQLLKFSLLPLALVIIKNSGTLQEYRKLLITFGNKSKHDGLSLTKEVEYWGFVAIVGSNNIKIRVVLRRVGNGNVTFWSVMAYSKLRRGNPQRLYTENIEDE
jgi:hypothetical protein